MKVAAGGQMRLRLVNTPDVSRLRWPMKIEEDTITFNSGHKAHATLGIVGINSQLELSEGYDRHIDWPVPEWWQKQHPERTLTNEDMRELADHMIGLWTKFKETLRP